ncbi:MAG TPA: hypothetical protein VFV38_46200 [Ktedonobacteraceae bacterium]|nr:hypothetical protein [Ktedonobacteraceae bacterium]
MLKTEMSNRVSAVSEHVSNPFTDPQFLWATLRQFCYERLAEIQEEILWICDAAHIPIILATRVLENFVRKGTPSRAEMTDAAMAERAECVMLNKGPYVAEAVTILDHILTRMQDHQVKKTSHLRALQMWQQEQKQQRNRGK